jgi:hypothetical protein
MTDDEVSFGMMIPLDSDGFLRCECPTCEREFKWRPSDPDTEEDGEPADTAGYFCPYCGVQAPGDAWLTQVQLALVQNIVEREFIGPLVSKLVVYQGPSSSPLCAGRQQAATPTRRSRSSWPGPIPSTPNRSRSIRSMRSPARRRARSRRPTSGPAGSGPPRWPAPLARPTGPDSPRPWPPSWRTHSRARGTSVRPWPGSPPPAQTSETTTASGSSR